MLQIGLEPDVGFEGAQRQSNELFVLLNSQILAIETVVKMAFRFVQGPRSDSQETAKLFEHFLLELAHELPGDKIFKLLCDHTTWASMNQTIVARTS